MHFKCVQFMVCQLYLKNAVWMDGWMHGWLDRWMDREVDRQMKGVQE